MEVSIFHSKTSAIHSVRMNVNYHLPN